MTLDTGVWRSGEVALSAEQARTLTDQIKVALEGCWQLVTQAYLARAWAALGYSSWDDYCTREFGTARLRLPREERQEVVASMREAGMSIRAISSATNTGVATVHRQLAGVPNGTPESIGVDGKSYPVTSIERHGPDTVISLGPETKASCDSPMAARIRSFRRIGFALLGSDLPESDLRDFVDVLNELFNKATAEVSE